MSRACGAVVTVLLISLSARGDTITVVGVVAYQPVGQATGVPRSGIEVGLYCNDAKSCRLGVKKATTEDGLYTLTKPNLNVTKVYVIYDGPQLYTADPVLVTVNCPGADEPCILVAKKLILHPPPLGNDNAAAARRINAFANTQSVKVWAGIIDAEQANEVTTREAAKTLGLATGIKKGDAEKTLSEVFKLVGELPPTDGLPKVKVLRDESEFMKLKGHTDFNKFQKMLGDPDRLKMKGLNVEDEMRYFLALPDVDIKSQWVEDEKHTDFVADYLKTKKTGSSSLLHFPAKGNGAKDRPGISVSVVNTVSGSDTKGVQTLLQQTPEVRAWAFYELLLHEKAVPADSKRLISDRLEGLRPIVIEQRK